LSIFLLEFITNTRVYTSGDLP